MIKILELSTKKDALKYKDFLKETNNSHPYYKIEFFDSFSSGTKDLFCILFEEGDSKAILPFYKNKIPFNINGQTFFDVVSPYGYSGPIFVNMDDSKVESFWRLSDDILLRENVVSEFIRFSLDADVNQYNGKLINTLSNIKGEILDEETLWKNSDHKVRKNVKRARRENLTYKIFEGKEITDDVLDDFHLIYIDTMKRTNAKANFMYSKSDFLHYISNNYKNSLIITIYDEFQPVSTEFIIKSEDTMFSFLGGTYREAFPKRPNDYLKFLITNWGRDNQVKYFVLGGGFGKDDGIFDYKKAFFPDDVVQYFSGRKVLNNEIYVDLSKKVEEFVLHTQMLPEQEFDDIVKKDFFPYYARFFEYLPEDDKLPC